jgi:predicted nucleic acid-binding protein
MYVIDASVHVADIRPGEPHHAGARVFLNRVAAEEWPVYLPIIALPEIAAAISRGTGEAALARRLIAALQRIPHFEMIPVDKGLAQLAAALAADHRIRGCDAIYVALAQERGATLITLDDQQRQRVPPNIAARSPAEELSEIEDLDR